MKNKQKKSRNKKEKITTNFGQKGICIAFTLFGSLLLIIGIVLKFLSVYLNNIDVKAYSVTSFLFLILSPILISILGIPLLLEATSYRDVVDNELEKVIEKLFSGKKQKEYLLSRFDDDKIFDCYVDKIGKADKALKNTLKKLNKNNLSKPIIVKDETEIEINIKEGKITKTITINQTFKKNNCENFTYQKKFECLKGTDIVIEDFTINDINYKEKFKTESTKTNKKTDYNNYDEPKVLNVKLNKKNSEFKLHLKVKYEVPEYDIFNLYCNRYLCKKLSHDIMVKSDVNVEIILAHNSTCYDSGIKKNSYRVSKLPNSANEIGTNIHKRIEFDSYSFPGDGYSYAIRYHK